MHSEKFSLKWNDFQKNVSQSFGLLRQEEDLFDVTLVSDDEMQIPAHKLVLSASSSFFKSIIRKNAHSHPLLYLGGINSRKLNFILDYIYHGEVQVYQEDLDGFIEAAQKLRIEGLRKDQENPTEGAPSGDFKIKAGYENSIYDESSDESYFDGDEENLKNSKTPERKLSGRTMIPTGGSVSTPELAQKIEELTMKIDGVYTCRNCGKTAKDKTHLTRHIETHIEGLEYNCSHCGKVCRSRNILTTHLRKYHRN